MQTLATTVNLVDFTAVTVTEYDEDLSSELTGVAGPKVRDWPFPEFHRSAPPDGLTSGRGAAGGAGPGERGGARFRFISQ